MCNLFTLQFHLFQLYRRSTVLTLILSQFFSTEQIYEMKNVNISSASMSGAQRPEESLILILNSNMVWLMKTGRGQISHLIGELIKTCKSSLKI